MYFFDVSDIKRHGQVITKITTDPSHLRIQNFYTNGSDTDKCYRLIENTWSQTMQCLEETSTVHFSMEQHITTVSNTCRLVRRIVVEIFSTTSE